MYEVAVTREFSAAHYLRDYSGPCERLHGHNYLVEVVVRGRELDDRGLLIDFQELKARLDEVIGELDHTLLNELSAFEGQSPTSEVISAYIAERLKSWIAGRGLQIAAVTVWENSRSRATFYPEPAGEGGM
ncbi:MAG: 6-carboxytetrahydropterin synthase QueD [Armatimonadetes bacterium]|nr:6-carboxytetrahydropterin synthase QueD [Armatimonadota bacterium]